MKETTRVPHDASNPRFKRERTKLFNVCKALDYTMSFDGPDLFTIYDEHGNYLGCMSAETWLTVIKTAMRSARRC